VSKAATQSTTRYRVVWDSSRTELEVVAREIAIRKRSSIWEELPLHAYESESAAQAEGWHLTEHGALKHEKDRALAESRRYAARALALSRALRGRVSE
jgi:hypothetical protein